MTRRIYTPRPKTAPKRGIHLALDMRITTEGLARLSPGQAQAVFEGVGRLAALGLGR